MFVPSIFVYSLRSKASDLAKLARYERLLKRRTRIHVDDESAEGTSVCHVGVNTDDVVNVDKGTSCDLRFENKSVNTDNIFQVQQDSLEARKEVASLKQENALLKEKILKVTSPVARMEGDG